MPDNYSGFHEVTGATIQVHRVGEHWTWQRGRIGWPPASTGGRFETAEAAWRDAMGEDALRCLAQQKAACEAWERWRRERVEQFASAMAEGRDVIGATAEEWQAAWTLVFGGAA